MYCTIHNFSFNLQLLKPSKVLKRPHWIVGTKQHHIFTERGKFSPKINFTMRQSKQFTYFTMSCFYSYPSVLEEEKSIFSYLQLLSCHFGGRMNLSFQQTLYSQMFSSPYNVIILSFFQKKIMSSLDG